MKSLNKLQIGIISFSVLVLVLLYFVRKTPEQSTEIKKPVGVQNAKIANLSDYVAKNRESLSDSLKKIEATLDQNKSLDSLVAFWDRIMRPEIAAFYTEKIAEKDQSAKAWIKAGERFYFSVRFVKDQEMMAGLYQHAMNAFEKGLAKDPNNIGAKIKYASCFVEGTQDPMKGITLLKEVEKVDSNNIDLQLAFAQFSTTSGQLDKAIIRLEKVLKIDPNYLEAYLYLADVYEQMGNKQKTIEVLEKYAELIPDKGAKKEIKTYIDKLKSN